MNKQGIKTLIIDDSGLMRIMLSDALRADPEILVVGTASNGMEGVEKIYALDPDVVITDMVMPKYGGLYVVRNIMAKKPRPIFLLSSLSRSNSEVFEALSSGAVDFIDKPKKESSKSFQRSMDVLISKIKMASTVNTSNMVVSWPKNNNHQHTFEENLEYDVIALGASTGGPSTIEYILGQLPSNLKIPVIIAQHMPERFIISFCERLEEKTPLKIRIASHDQIIKPGTIYLAPGTDNLMVASAKNGDKRFQFTKQKFKNFNNPSIDCLFESIAETFGPRTIAAILTGMGKDGAEGLKKIRNIGGLTIAQDKNSCVVYGMPKAAINAKAVDYTLKLKEIPGFIVSCL
ncbi:chemotaxis-specific protein-glutamate methyltransferase CheB [Fulvivirgaceae bacterium BMA10]|uniref:Protein-glutamate methylesterase/protein-glutamine glutaminase n=1 Tax=Splendidivirga corallicola TaxID=3051826 RepID=A0ABT8KW35_9BACT|nr:chemotaxis-specific protein-glutamate methyltransferase CheB [Fulvivirgaceae bacterium BMA10]